MSATIKNYSLLSNYIKCLNCDKEFKFSEEKDQYLAHLFLIHRLVIADVDKIADLEEYLRYWIIKFQDNPLEEFCTTLLLDQLPDGNISKDEKYFLLSDVLPEDLKIREKLHNLRLEKVLTQHQFELTDREFRKDCLYCRDIISGLRSEYLHHLFNKHFLLLGKPENLVYIDELISLVQEKLENLKCLYCEKIFKDRETLKEHMRKKGHKRINPNNKSYDRFFLINYQSSIQKDNPCKLDQTQRIKTSHKSMNKSLQKNNIKETNKETVCKSYDNDDSDSEWATWYGEQPLFLQCLFCFFKDTEISTLKQHMLHNHEIDFDKIMKEHNFYHKIKIVNYVRRQINRIHCISCDLSFETNEELIEHMKEKKHFTIGDKKYWDRAEFFFSTYDDDNLLQFLDDSDSDDSRDIPVISESCNFKTNEEALQLLMDVVQIL